jgi:hypothetical protein
MNHNIEDLNHGLQHMEARKNIGFLCGFILLVLLICPTIRVYDSSDNCAVPTSQNGVNISAKERKGEEIVTAEEQGFFHQMVGK